MYTKKLDVVLEPAIGRIVEEEGCVMLPGQV